MGQKKKKRKGRAQIKLIKFCRDAPFPEISICLSKSPDKRSPFRFPTGVPYGILTGLRDPRTRKRASIPGKDKMLYLLQSVEKFSGPHPVSYESDIRGFFP
jgi:hypothetical protein